MIAAVEQFLRDTAPPPAGSVPAPGPSPWVRAARLEAVHASGAPAPHPWLH